MEGPVRLRPLVAGLCRDSLRQISGLPAEALAKAGGGEGSRTPVLEWLYIDIYMRVPQLLLIVLRLGLWTGLSLD